ncbi:Rad17-domain-containing protein, partial [Glonium stellatum]
VDRRPWTEKYGPINLGELAVHRKKVADVRAWLDEVFAGRERKRLLLLKGPAGSGKTTTMSLLSKELGFEVHEWRNPTAAVYSSEGFVSMAAQFEDFIGRTDKFGSLDFGEPKRSSQVVADSKSQNRGKQIILVEEFPNTFARSASVGQTFRNTIQQFLAANTPSVGTFFGSQRECSESITPLVMIISETLLSTSTAAADSFTAHRLLGAEVLNHPGVSIIEFNPIAPTLMAKALELVVLKEARKSGRRKTPGPQVIKRLSETGDIRSAVSSLEFLCVRGDEDDGWGTKVAFTKPKKGVREVPLTRMEQESLESVTQRESTLGIFHAVGKVVYNKREPALASDQSLPQPPNYFPEHRRPKASEVQVDTLIDELGTDIQTFIAALHENYLLSCEGPTGEDTMDSINGSIDALSDSDLLSPDRFNMGGAGRRMFQGTSVDNLRQDEMSFQVSVRGLLFSLPSPVKRIAPPSGTMNGRGKGGSKGGAFQMFYPTSLRIWRQREEIEGILGLWATRAQKGDLFTPAATTTARKQKKPGSVESWRRNGPFSQSPKKASISSAASADKTQEETAPLVLGSGSSARYEMLLERLPYVASILRHRLSTNITPTLREIDKVISFTGIGGPSDEIPDEDDHVSEFDQWSTDPPASQHSLEERQRSGKVVTKVRKDHEAPMLPGAVEKEVAKLVLSDDDIED